MASGSLQTGRYPHPLLGTLQVDYNSTYKRRTVHERKGLAAFGIERNSSTSRLLGWRKGRGGASKKGGSDSGEFHHFQFQEYEMRDRAVGKRSLELSR